MGVTTEPGDGGAPADRPPTLVVLGGPPPPQGSRRRPASRVIGVDSGVDHALAAGLVPDVAVGDLDSISATGLARIERDGIRIDRHPPAKDATDLELALEIALEDGPGVVTVVGGHPDERIDHWLGTILSLASPRWQSLRIRAWLGGALVVPVHDHAEVDVDDGAVVSLFAVNGDAEIAATEGLAWAMLDDVLLSGSSRGVSNVATASRIAVTVRSGVVLVVVPEPGGA